MSYVHYEIANFIANCVVGKTHYLYKNYYIRATRKFMFTKLYGFFRTFGTLRLLIFGNST